MLSYFKWFGIIFSGLKLRSDLIRANRHSATLCSGSAAILEKLTGGASPPPPYVGEG